MSNIRRSARLQSRTADEDGYDSDENTAKYIESDESVTSESDSGEDEDQDDDDYMEGKKRARVVVLKDPEERKVVPLQQREQGSKVLRKAGIQRIIQSYALTRSDTLKL